MGYTEEQYRAGYERALKAIREAQPKAKLILALSTPLKSTSSANSLNPRGAKPHCPGRPVGAVTGL